MTFPPLHAAANFSLKLLAGVFLCLLAVRVVGIVNEDLARVLPFAVLAVVATHFVLRKVRQK